MSRKLSPDKALIGGQLKFEPVMIVKKNKYCCLNRAEY